MTLTKELVSVAVLAVVLPLAAACSDGGDSYCDAVRASSSELQGSRARLGDKDAMARVVGAFKKIEGAAPDDIKAEWTTLRSLLEKFTADNRDLLALAAEAEKLKPAAERVETQVKEACNIDITTF